MSVHLAGQKLGNVRIDTLIGEGAAGVVYRGHHTTLDHAVAIKVFKLEIGGHDRAKYLERFQREAQLMAKLNHPGIVRVHDFGDIDGRPYIVMDFIDGFSLAEYLARRSSPVPEQLALKLILAAANALGAAHRVGIIHRDLKPANLLLGRNGKLYLADLGLAREVGGAGLTHNRIVVGSPAYMSPESFTPGRSVDTRHDLYALGVIGYELCFSRMPYEGSVEEVMRGHVGGQARFDLPTTCSPQVIGLVRKLMAYDPGARYQQAEDVVAEVKRLLGIDTAARRRNTADGSSGSRGVVGSSGTDFSGIIRFIDERLRAETSFVDGGRVVHSTSRERLLVWMLLAAVLVVAVIGYISTRPAAPAPAPAAEEAAAGPMSLDPTG